ncbi:ATP-dependent DNA helicase [Coniophora puteana RWD-64-598 SS2]|uniref:ATP-dependent DNA helicase n=1 Tax=Coniophora puteana (strain RWD-64-598) TaxID=741705 RepID=A0A5M3MCW5_CONPW|nr:ATP-dependent DNA helicase [Coniophora puteana RWD-64-598 SS2]EIW76690.1 ATP-dependent DNA helicase [Coniophora puteana RWD-64-598 SS2]
MHAPDPAATNRGSGEDELSKRSVADLLKMMVNNSNLRHHVMKQMLQHERATDVYDTSFLDSLMTQIEQRNLLIERAVAQAEKNASKPSSQVTGNDIHPTPPRPLVQEISHDFFDDIEIEPPTKVSASSGSQTAHTSSPSASYPASTSTRQDHTASPYYSEIISNLKNTFKLSSFRTNQLEAITATLDGRDVFVLMPTGGGKSLCYQLPAICKTGKTQGVTIVITPLLALMTDQVMALKAKNIDAVSLSSGAFCGETTRDVESRLRRKGAPKPSLVYVTPERMQNSNSLLSLLDELNDSKQLARFVVDEAHVIQSWGRDFRDAYKELNVLRNKWPNVPIMALTATADETAIRDITTQLQLKDEVKLMQSFNRPNLSYTVRPKPNNKKQATHEIATFIKSRHPNSSGVVYCWSRNDCEEVASQLRDDFGLSAHYYHAGIDTATRPVIQSDWLSGKFKIVVATIAFGMGIDKPDVRFVIHHSLPKDMDGYYQETGRAGRDGLQSDCVLFFSNKDLMARSSMVQNDSEKSAEEKERQAAALRAVATYCSNEVECRRTMVLRHFGEKFDPANCHKQCDNCRKDGASVTQDLTAYAQRVIELHKQMSATGSMIATGTLKAVFKGRNIKAVREGGYQQLSLCGAGKDLDAAILDRLIEHMLHNTSILRIERVARGQWTQNYVELGDQADDCLKGRLQVCLAFRDEDIGSSNQSYSGSSIGRQRPAKAPASGSTRPRESVDANNSFNEDDLYDDNDGDPISDFEPIREAPDPQLMGTTSLSRVPSNASFAASRPAEHDNTDIDEELVQLRELRQKFAVQKGVNCEEIFEDFILDSMAAVRPKSIDELKGLLSTLCPNEEEALVKLDRYGKGFVRIFAHGSSDSLAGLKSTTPFHSSQLHRQYDYAP